MREIRSGLIKSDICVLEIPASRVTNDKYTPLEKYLPMSTPFPLERSDSLQPASTRSNGLNAEYANMVQIPQLAQTDKPQVVSSDGTQLVIPPIGLTGTDQTAASTVVKPGGDTTTSPTDTSTTAAAQTAPAEKQSVSTDPSLVVPAWQRFSEIPVATDGTMLPAPGPGSPGDSGSGAMHPMWMYLAPPGMINPNELYGETTAPQTPQTDQTASASATTSDGGDSNGGDASA
jgi:hypothetical protein